jgi:hypothetical protein
MLPGSGELARAQLDEAARERAGNEAAYQAAVNDPYLQPGLYYSNQELDWHCSLQLEADRREPGKWPMQESLKTWMRDNPSYWFAWLRRVKNWYTEPGGKFYGADYDKSHDAQWIASTGLPIKELAPVAESPIGTAVQHPTIQPTTAPQFGVISAPPIQAPTNIGHAEARALLLEHWKNIVGHNPSLVELQIVGAIGLFEGRYGCTKAANNWGGIQCTEHRGHAVEGHCVDVNETDDKGHPYIAQDRVWPTPQTGADAFLQMLVVNRPSTGRAIITGNVDAVARDMKNTWRYAVPVTKYANAIYTCAQTIAKALSEKLEVTRDIPPNGDGGLPWIFAAFGIGVLLALKRR